MAQVARQAANACYVGGAGPMGMAPPVDMAKLKEALKDLPETEAAVVMHAVQILQSMAAMAPKPPPRPPGEDW
jgi:hypothetical protein